MSKEHPPKGFNPFADLIGLQFTHRTKGHSECELQVREELLNPARYLHGGVMYAMADTGMGAAIFPELADDESCATVEIKMSYLRPVAQGTLTCATTMIQKGKTLAVFESELKNGGKVVAKALGTYMIFKKK